jgi:hypothetical protein
MITSDIVEITLVIPEIQTALQDLAEEPPADSRAPGFGLPGLG